MYAQMMLRDNKKADVANAKLAVVAKQDEEEETVRRMQGDPCTPETFAAWKVWILCLCFAPPPRWTHFCLFLGPAWV